MESRLLRRFLKFSSGSSRERSSTPSDLSAELRTLAFDFHKDPVFIMANGVIVTANPACLAVFGARRPEDFVGQKIVDRLTTTQPDGLALRASLDAFNREITRDGVARRLWGFKRLSGEAFTVRSTLSPITHGEQRCTLAVLEDITQFHRAQEVRRESEAAQARVVEHLASGLAALAAGNLTARLESPFDPRYELLRHDFNYAAAEIQKVMSSIVGAVDTVATGAVELRLAISDLAQRSERHSEAIDQTAMEMKTIAAGVRSTAEGADQARATAATAESSALEGGRVMEIARETMSGIDKYSLEINQITGVIDEIAFQTNLLALNAGVEAARAGDAGRGFAVVAMEVRALAQRSREAANKIQQLLTSSRTQVEAGVVLVAQGAESIAKILAAVSSGRRLVDEIASTAAKQAAGMGAVMESVRTMELFAQQNAAMTEQTNATCIALSDEGERLGQLASHFQVDASAAGATAAPERASFPRLVARR